MVWQVKDFFGINIFENGDFAIEASGKDKLYVLLSN